MSLQHHLIGVVWAAKLPTPPQYRMFWRKAGRRDALFASHHRFLATQYISTDTSVVSCM